MSEGNGFFVVVSPATYAALEKAAMLADPLAEMFRRVNRGTLHDPLFGAAVVKQQRIPTLTPARDGFRGGEAMGGASGAAGAGDEAAGGGEGAALTRPSDVV